MLILDGWGIKWARYARYISSCLAAMIYSALVNLIGFCYDFLKSWDLRTDILIIRINLFID